MSRSGSGRPGLAADSRGAAAIEFGLIIGLIIMLVIGTLEVGRVLAARNAVSHALSQTVRVVHLNPDITPAQIQDHLSSLLSSDASLEVCVRPVPGTSIAEIKVFFPFELAVPFLPVRQLTLLVDTIAPRIKNEEDLLDTC